MNFDAAARAYVRFVMEEKNLKPGALAQKAGISASTLTRALNDPKHKFKLTLTTLQKIADFSGINPAPFIEAKDSAELTTGVIHRPDLYTKKADDTDEWSREYGTKLTLIVGEIEAGKWREPSPINYFDYGPLTLTSTSHATKDCFAVVVKDDSANMIADKEDVLFCVRIDEKSAAETRAKFARWGTGPVIVERRSRDAFKIEMTARFIKNRPDGTWDLVSANREDHFEKGGKKRRRIEKINLPEYTGNDEYRIVGTVEWVIRGDTQDATNYVTFDMPT